jgi:DNA-binding winged helix-turn-helix (wHTH) protein/tetratricopeptide (TPR) repeat protein
MRVCTHEVEVGPFLIDLATGRLLRDSKDLALRPQACRVLKTLIQNRGQYVDYEHMIAEAWDGTVVSRHTVDVTVGEVRKTLQEFGSWITHRPKVGYKLDVPKSEDLVRKGWHFWNRRTPEGFEKALVCFQAAALEDGMDFRVYEGLAATYLMSGTYCLRHPHAVRELFQESLDQAIALAGKTPELRAHLAHGLHIFRRDFAQAETEFLQVEREKPTLTKTYGLLAMLYTSLGRFDEALQVLAKGYKVDPLFPSLPAVEVSVHFFARNYQEAIASGRKCLELHPYILVGRCYYAQALEYAGLLEEALAEYRRACLMLPGLIWLRALEAACLSKCGRKADASVILEEVEQMRHSEYVDAYYLALLYHAMGIPDKALAELERAVDESSITLCLLDVDPKMDALRKHPRFAQLHRRVFNKQLVAYQRS